MRLYPGWWVSPFGTTAAIRPELAGVVVADVLRPFAARNPSGLLLCTGVLQDRVVREDAGGYLTFYQRIVRLSEGALLYRMSREDLRGGRIEVDYRRDGLGLIGVERASRAPFFPGAPDRILFDFQPAVHSEALSRFIFVRTEARSFTERGMICVQCTVRGDPNLSSCIRSFQPA